MLIIIVCIKFDSKGSVFFLQKRLGLKGKEFLIIKFRTMYMGSEKNQIKCFRSDVQCIEPNDIRITKVGKFLRKYSLDEIPQIFNTLIGDMSLVGPRPPYITYPYDGIHAYPYHIQRRFDVRPGITGLAQIKFRSSVDWNERFKCDLEYIDKKSIMLDLIIIFKTIYVVLRKKNVYYV
jgi:lipopolysaccharide/colanic/teichoic acid biosynthesis glycosyltransferase